MTSVPAAAIVEQGLAGALEEAEHQLRARFQNSRLAMFEADTTLHITAWNSAAERLFGYLAGEAIGQPVSFLIAAPFRARWDAAWRALDASSEFTGECVDKRGRSRTCRWYCTPITTLNGIVIGVSSVVIDLFEHGRTEQADVRACHVESLSKVADGVAHDFTNVFAVVLSYANFIKESSPVGDPRRDDALEILSAAGEGTALIRRLLSVSERFTGEKPIELNESLLQLRGLLLRSLGEHRELQLIESRSALVVRIDPVRFDQLLSSLTLAASETAPDTRPLRILLESGGNPGFARITVQCVESELTETAGSSELSLLGRPLDPSVPEMAACLGIVESAGGSIVARATESLGKIFIVELPLWVESSSAAPPQLEAGPGHGLVLIAEGDTALRRAAARALSLEGYEVQVAAEYDEAVALLAKLGTRLDVLIGDLALPGCADYELVAEARRLAPSAAVLVTAAFASGPENAGSRQDVKRLYKPLQPGELVAAVRAALAGRVLQSSSGERPSRDGQGELVLVVEDDDSMRAALARILECAGYWVCQAARLAEARKQLETGPEPALVLCDLSLPDGSSVELMNWILATRPALRGRVFVLSGGAVEDADIAFVRSGVVPVLRKPIEPGPLLQILGRARAGLGSSV